jgi:putative PEP-CTERM system TPR-repeat lipoprotein
MADVLLGNKDREGAARSLRKALAIKPDLLSAQRGFIMLELVSGRVQEATLIAREVQQQRPLEAVGYLLEGDIRAARKSWNEAVDAYRLGLKRVASVDLAMKLHQALIAGGNPQDAAGFAVTWLRAQPKDNAIFRLYLAEHFSAQGDFQDAALHYRALLAERPDSPEILNNLAYVTAQLKEGQALEYAEKANKLAPNQPAFMDTLGVILTETGQVGRAIEVLEKAVQVAPQENRVRLSLARALIKAGKPAEAKKQLAEIAKAGDKFVGQAEVARLMQSL